MIEIEIKYWPTSINFYKSYPVKIDTRGSVLDFNYNAEIYFKYKNAESMLIQKWTEYIYARIRVRIHTKGGETVFKGVSEYI